MEHNHGGLVQISFLSKWVICRFQPLIFQGVRVYLSSTNLADGLLLMVDLTSGVYVSTWNPKETSIFAGQVSPKRGRNSNQNKGPHLGSGYIYTWNPKQPLINGCFNWMILNLYIGNAWKSPFPSTLTWWALGFQVLYIANIQQTKRSLENPQPQVDHRSTRVEWSFLPTKMQQVWST